MRTVFVSTIVLLLCAAVMADPIPAGWSCVGSCGSSGPNGVVTTSPLGGLYEWVTSAGPSGTGQYPGIGGTNGSVLQTLTFTANGTDQLKFYFNYVTSDGAIYADYAWVQLVNINIPAASVLLFTARTTTSGDTVPGFGMPPIANGVTLVPPHTPIIAGGPAWAPLGTWSGSCYSTGCGYTDWIEAQYTPAAGEYYLVFGVSNWLDGLWDSGLAIDGVKIGNTPIDDEVPEPGTLLLLGTGLFGVAGAIRRKLA